MARTSRTLPLRTASTASMRSIVPRPRRRRRPVPAAKQAPAAPVVVSWRRLAWQVVRWLAQYSVECLRQSSVHGMAHIATPSRRHPAERALWALIVGAAGCGVVALSLSHLHRYLHMPTVISMERDYMAWNTTFPPVTICPEAKFDPERVAQVVPDLAREYGVKNATALREFVEALGAATLHSLQVLTDVDTNVPSHAYLGIIEKVSLPLNHSVATGMVADAAAHESTLAPTLTELGMCFSFNSLLAPYLSPRYWRLGEDAVKGRRPLLEINPLDGTVAAQLSGLPGRYQLFLHGPGEVPDLQSPFLTSPEGQFKRLEVSTLALLTAREVRDLPPHRRRCRFTDEPVRAWELDDKHLAPGVPVYSYNLCRRSCRAALLLSACKCVPHLYGPMYNRHGAQVPMCAVPDFRCVTANLGFIYTLVDPGTGAPFPCPCLVNCDESQYVIESDTNNEWFLGTDLKWNLLKYPRMRLRRLMLFGVTDLLVHVGSTYGLFLGGSALSLAEFVYFVTLGLFWRARAQLQRMRAPVAAAPIRVRGAGRQGRAVR